MKDITKKPTKKERIAAAQIAADLKEKEEILKALNNFTLGNHSSRVDIKTQFAIEINEKLDMIGKEIIRLYSENRNVRCELLEFLREQHGGFEKKDPVMRVLYSDDHI
jgi:hypothetical protein